MISRKALIALSALVALAIGAASSQARTWTQAATGNKIEAEFVRMDGNTVVLNVGGRQAQVPLDQLSADDQAFVKEATASGGTPKAGGASVGSGAGDWPQWRGADRSGISPDTGLMSEWPEDGPKQLWVFEGAGMGYSSYSIVGGKLYTLGTRDEDLYLICVNTEDGSEVWAAKISEDDQKGYNVGWGHGPRSTPTYDDGHLYLLGPKGTVACVSAEDGKVQWKKNLVDDFGGKVGGWGFAESPLVDGDQVVVGPGGSDAGIVALNKKTGATLWKADDVKPGKAEYASIVPVEMNGTRQYIRLFADQCVSVSAKNGKLLWTTDWGGGKSPAVIPTPIVEGNEVYITSGYGVGSKLVKIDESNKPSDVWSNSNMKNKHGGVIKVGDHIYGFSEGGGLICQDWKTGEVVWNEKGQFLGSTDSLTVADGMLYCLNQDTGTMILAEASPEGFVQKGQFTLEPQSEDRNPKGKIWVPPVVVGGKLYLRDQEIIACYDVKKG